MVKRERELDEEERNAIYEQHKSIISESNKKLKLEFSDMFQNLVSQYDETEDADTSKPVQQLFNSSKGKTNNAMGLVEERDHIYYTVQELEVWKEQSKLEDQKRKEEQANKLSSKTQQDKPKNKQEAKKEKLEKKQNLLDTVEKGTFGEKYSSLAYQRRDCTVSIAIPGSILRGENQLKAKALVANQIARFCSLYRIDEIVIYNDTPNTSTVDEKLFMKNLKPDRVDLESKGIHLQKKVEEFKQNVAKFKQKEQAAEKRKKISKVIPENVSSENSSVESAPKLNGNVFYAGKDMSRLYESNDDENLFLANILYYLETPQYLRSLLFPIVDFLKITGTLHPLQCPHHQLSDQMYKYREGVVTEEGNMVYIGLQKLVTVDEKLPPGTRVTVRIDTIYSLYYYGQVVAARSPKMLEGVYWGYDVRLEQSLSQVFEHCRYDTGYDCVVGVSDDEFGKNVENKQFSLPHFKHLLFVFGGLDGLKASCYNDPKLKQILVDAKAQQPPNSSDEEMNYGQLLFHKLINICPYKGSEYIRMEESLYMTLGRLQPWLNHNIVPSVDKIPKIPTKPFSYSKFE